ncbi:hypothetical protein CDEST_11764 [Colletotrichum destructivum]|uniref:Uncharacterized protein n=1 Tax=Colletotrichum destructivum TaxID=34406 RepID=A0AAX4IU63_9PEZI|nr:hypothetical protein CDEST_11764 [Colletotrichum destructivum]
MSDIEVLSEFGARRRQEVLEAFSTVNRMHYTISRDDTAGDHSRQERTLGEWAEQTRRRRLPLFPSGHDGSEAKHERTPVGDAALVAHLGAGSLPDFVSSARRESPYQSRAQSRTTALSSARQTITSYRYEVFGDSSEDEAGSQTSLTDEDDFYNDTTSLPEDDDNVGFFESVSSSGKHEWGGEESATQANISSAEKPRLRQAGISYEKPSRDRQDDIRDRERVRRRREERDRQSEKLQTIREHLKSFKRISELASEEEIRQQEFMPLQDDLPVPPVPLPSPKRQLMTPNMRFDYQSRFGTGIDFPPPGLIREDTFKVRYATPPPDAAEKDSSRRSSKTKKRKTPLLADVPETDSITWHNE